MHFLWKNIWSTSAPNDNMQFFLCQHWSDRKGDWNLTKPILQDCFWIAPLMIVCKLFSVNIYQSYVQFFFMTLIRLKREWYFNKAYPPGLFIMAPLMIMCKFFSVNIYHSYTRRDSNIKDLPEHIHHLFFEAPLMIICKFFSVNTS